MSEQEFCNALSPLAEGESSSPPRGEGVASSAVRLAGVAGVLLGWRPEEFWSATPAELAIVLRALAPETGKTVDVRALMERFPDD